MQGEKLALRVTLTSIFTSGCSLHAQSTFQLTVTGRSGRQSTWRRMVDLLIHNISSLFLDFSFQTSKKFYSTAQIYLATFTSFSYKAQGQTCLYREEMKIQKVNILTFTHNTNKINEKKCHFITIGQNKMPCIGGNKSKHRQENHAYRKAIWGT